MATLKGSFPKASPKTIALLESLVPAGPNIELKPMFGHRAAFVNGNMFAGTFGDSLVVRLGDAERAALLEQKGASIFEPMKGRPMNGYVRVDPTVMKRDLGRWITKALAFTRGLPPKAKKTKTPKARKKTAKRA